MSLKLPISQNRKSWGEQNWKMFPPSLIENGRRLIEQLFLSLHTTFRLKRWTSLSNPLDFFLSWPTVTSLSPPSIKLLRLLWHDWAKVSEEEGKGKSMRWGRANVRVVGGLNKVKEYWDRRRRLCEEERVEREIERERGRTRWQSQDGQACRKMGFDLFNNPSYVVTNQQQPKHDSNGNNWDDNNHDNDDNHPNHNDGNDDNNDDEYLQQRQLRQWQQQQQLRQRRQQQQRQWRQRGQQQLQQWQQRQRRQQQRLRQRRSQKSNPQLVLMCAINVR